MVEQEKQDIRWVRLEEIKLSRLYKDLVPRPSEGDRQLLKESIAERGFDPAHSFVVNMDLLLLDGYTRQEIGEELKKEWAPVVFRDYGSPEAEQEFIILAAAARRQLNGGQLAFLGLKLLEIEEIKAKKRQLAGQEKGRLHRLLLSQSSTVENEETIERSSENPETLNLAGDGSPPLRGETNSKHHKESIRQVAKKLGVGHNTLRKAKEISKAAETKPEIAKDVEDIKAGKKKVTVIYAKVKSWKQETAEQCQKLEEEEIKYQVPREELVATFREVAKIKNMPMEAVEELMETDSEFLDVWRQIRLGLVTLTAGWCFINWKIHVRLRERKGLDPDPEYHRRIVLEMKKSYLVLLMQWALRMIQSPLVSATTVELITGIDRKLFPYMLAWSDRLDLLAEQVNIRSRLRP